VRHDGGFTLLEIMVALAIGGIVVLSAERLFAGAADGGRALERAREGLDREGNGRRWLQLTFLSLELGDSGSTGFGGDTDRMHFTAWEPVAGGWLEPREVELGVSGGQFVALVSPGEPVVLAESCQSVAFDYLLEPGADSRWVRQWVSPASAPLAVRIRLKRAPAVEDSLLLLIKGRG
jgi:prepilin-type N-terminal cleavage/methylation domain-containing protein